MTRIHLKVMAGLATVVVLTVLVSGYLAERGLRQQALAQLEVSLTERAALLAVALEELPFARTHSPELTRRVALAARAAGARVTLMAPDGEVVADSEVAAADLDRVENHASRPEVRVAAGGATGSHTRTSATVGRPLLYLAIPAPEGQGVVRLAVELPDVHATVALLRRQLLVAGFIGLIAALAASWVWSWMSLRSFGELREVLSSLAGGDFDRRLRWRMRDERREIAAAVNTMAEQLAQRVSQLTSEKEQLRAVLEGMVEGVLVLGAEGHVLLANSALRELLGVWGEVEGRLPLEVIRHAEVDAVLSEAQSGDRTVARTLELGGDEAPVVEVHAVPLAHAEGGGVVAVFHDITELRRLEAMRRDFVANASHELKTPVTAIRGFAEILATHDVSPDDQKKQLGIIGQNAERLTRLVDDLLELSRIESGRMQLQPETLDAREVSATVLADLGPMYAQRGVQAELEEGTPVLVRADRVALEQILRNLLDNAAKYTDAGGHVCVRVHSRDGSGRIEVEDDGIGIAPEQRARIFERFYRVDATRSRALGGTGLGLAIVKHLVQALGGDVQLKSQPRQGSTFSVTLPTA